jgi:3D (Asp-Asp-Asp) domain-containing protein
MIMAMPIMTMYMKGLVTDNRELTRKLDAETQKASQLEHQLQEEQKRSEDIQSSLDSLQQELQKTKDDNAKLQQELAERPIVDKTLYMTGTGYTANDAGMNGLGHTRSGTICKQGRTISVDPSVIPLGTKVEIESASYPQINGVYVAEDTGSAIKGHIIDIYFDSKGAANDFGRRKDLVVKVLRT